MTANNASQQSPEEVAKAVIESIKQRGDEALREFARKYDNADINDFLVSKEEIKRARESVPREIMEAMLAAKKNIEKFARRQMRQYEDFEIETMDGVFAGQRILPMERVGCYVPGGNYPLPSTVLMTVVPARVAGVNEIIVCSPPKDNNTINPVTIAAADICGVDKIYKIGGPAAIAAMALGTESVPKVDKIVGPGNAYVTAAKKLLYGIVGIDLLAGPTEILVIADGSADPILVAADLLSESEHDENTSCTLITDSASLAFNVKKEMERQLARLETREITSKALRNKRVFLVASMKEAIEKANEIAPEHVELQAKNASKLVPLLKNYGSLFIGKYTPSVLGDYCIGTNHVLPTGGSARFSSGLSVKDFINVRTYQYVRKDGYERIAGIAIKLAGVEKLDAHKKSAEARMK
ncbi:MAG: histidinol dehydrogenase [Candidatus Aenigmarchaeota archaeon]|nr:histidinol dehydrogenase [Candidatus Aenigmarchaeota archaeon]